MKKKVVIILAVVICLVAVIFAVKSLSGPEVKDEGGKVVSIDSNIPSGSSDEEESTKETEKEKEEPTEDETEDNSWHGYEGETKNPDEIVSVKIPLGFVDAKYRNNLSAYASANGFESATLSFDRKNVTIKMRALSYDLMKIKIGVQTMQAICETFKSESFPYVINLGEYKDDFSYVTLLVDEEGYENSKNKDDLFGHVANCCAYYMLYDNASGNDLKIDIVSEKTGELLEARSYNKKDYLG